MWGIALQSIKKWFFNTLVEKRRIRNIAKLSSDIEKRILETLAPIDEKSAPKEIRPLIKAINRLVFYFEDRFQHEQDFSANASHELRTPLAGIRLQTEIAISTDDPDTQKKAHQNILLAIDQNERLIEQLLTLARLTSDRVELSMERINIGQLASHVVAQLLSIAEAKNISLRIESWDNAYILASSESLSILLHNLIRNAINYTPNGGKIRIKIESKSNEVILSVADNGPGIPEDKYKVVLKRFQKTGNDSRSGSGLGLAIVKRICDLHHAKLKLGKATKAGGLKVKVTFAN